MLPEIARRRAGFMLTPLIDVIFLLLIFFMLSSQVAPYSLLPFGGGAAAETGEGRAAGAPVANAPTLRVGRDIVLIGGSPVAMPDFPSAVADLQAQGVRDFLVVTLSAATVQDVTTALEVLHRAGAGRVSLLPPRSDP